MVWNVKGKWKANGREASFVVLGPQTEQEVRDSLERTHPKIEIVSVEPAGEQQE